MTKTEVSCGGIVMQPSAEACSQAKAAAAMPQTECCPRVKNNKPVARSDDLTKAAASQQPTIYALSTMSTT